MSNILLTRAGILKLGIPLPNATILRQLADPGLPADFGLAREWSPRPLTPGVVTVWYRSPELLLSATRYTPSVDVWATGCIMGELITCSPLLPGETELQQWALISALLGVPTERIWPRMRSLPGLPDEHGRPRPPPIPRSTNPNVNLLERRLVGQKRECIGLVNELLTYDPDMRPSASKALRHPYFTREAPAACLPEMIQTFPEIRNFPGGAAAAAAAAAASASATTTITANSAANATTATTIEAKRGNEAGYVFDFGEGAERKRRRR